MGEEHKTDFNGDVESFRGRVKEILSHCDLETTSSKTVRKQLEKEFNIELKAYKKEIDDLVVDVLNSIPESEDNESNNGESKGISNDEEDSSQLDADVELAKRLQMEENLMAEKRQTRHKTTPKKPSKKRTLSDVAKTASRKTGKEMGLSQPLQDLFGVSKMSRPQVVKALWEYIKEHKLQDESDRRFIICNEALSKVFQGRKRVGAFKMNQFLSSQLYSIEDANDGTTSNDIVDESSDEHEDSEPAPKKPNKKPRKPAKNGFTALVQVSEPLAELIGLNQLPRTQVIKKIWEYVKERNLQDQSDKRYIVCDEKLEAVFKTKRVHMFTMNKILVKHMTASDNQLTEELIDEE